MADYYQGHTRLDPYDPRVQSLAKASHRRYLDHQAPTAVPSVSSSWKIATVVVTAVVLGAAIILVSVLVPIYLVEDSAADNSKVVETTTDMADLPTTALPTIAEPSTTTNSPTVPPTTSGSTTPAELPTTKRPPTTAAPTTTVPSTTSDSTTTTEEPETTTMDTTTIESTTTTEEPTTTEPTTTTPEITTPKLPEVVIMPNSVTITFQNAFINPEKPGTFNLFVTSMHNATLNESATWASTQNSEDTDFAYVTIQCDDIFANGECSGGLTRRRKRQADVSSVTIQIGVEICDSEAINEICNGPLVEGVTYYFILQKTIEEGSTEPLLPISVMTATYGTWDEWETWQSCDETCGGGIQRRSRDCDSDFCEGSETSSQKCNTEVCPITAVAGIWFSWTEWSECTATCGDSGRKIRTRTCDNGDNNLDCVGESLDIAECNPWLCPDCSEMPCDPGEWSASCTRCACLGQHNGVVQSTDGTALSGVEIVTAGAPYDILATTSVNGRFSLDTVCIGDTLLFVKEGYVSRTYKGDSISDEVELEKLESLMIEEHPVSKKRLVGEDVLFCCTATSVAEQFEWFKDDVPIPGETQDTLTILNITRNSAGSYRCRASTQSAGIYSSEASLTVKENSDEFCQDSIVGKFEQLPFGCGQLSFDVGGCENLRCHGDTDIGETCQESETFCCTAKEFKKHIIQCNGFNYTLYKTVSCGCTKCNSPTITVRGFVEEKKPTFNQPVSNVELYSGGSKVATSGSFGQFTFRLSNGTEHVVIVAKSPNSTTYVDTVKVLSFHEEANGKYSKDILLPKFEALTPINTTVDQTIEFAIGDYTMMIEVPADSVYDASGTIIQDSLTPYVSILDPSNVEDMELAPGDFKTIDEYGETQLMWTFGMLYVKLEMMDSDSIQFLEEASSEIKIAHALLGSVGGDSSPDTSSALEEIKLFSLNTVSGHWVELASIDNSTNSYISTVSAASFFGRWINIGVIAGDICYSKIRVFEDDGYSEDTQLQDSNVFAYVNSSDGKYLFSSTIAADDDQTDGYCLAHPCITSGTTNEQLAYIGVLFVKSGSDVGSSYLTPASSSNTNLEDTLRTSLNYEALTDRLGVSLDLTVVSDNQGPLYDNYRKWQYSPECVSAAFTDKHFRFHLQKENKCSRSQGFHFKSKLTETCQPFYYKSWHNVEEIESRQYTTCHIKVQIAYYTTGIAQAKSAVGTMKYNSRLDKINPGDTYGFHEGCPLFGAACLKVKPPGTRGCATSDGHNKVDEFTQVSIRAWDKDTGDFLGVSKVNESLQEEYPVLQNDTVFTFEMASSESANGIFCETAASATESDMESFVSCLSSPQDMYAVKFGDAIDCALELILILENKTETLEYTSNFTSWLSEIGRSIYIDSRYVHVSLTITDNTDNLSKVNIESNADFEDTIDSYPDNFASDDHPVNIGAAYNDSIEDNSLYKVLVFLWTGSLTTTSLVVDTMTGVYSVTPANSTLTSDQRDAVNGLTTEYQYYLDEYSPKDFIEELKGWC